MVFYLGTSTAAHQIEGNNINSDFWAQEQMENSIFAEPSLDAVDHYHRFKEDIDLMADAGFNAYRFSIEWARIEPEKGRYCSVELNHYKEVIDYCYQKGIEPFVTLHHFSSPKWLISEGGWENPATVDYFRNYTQVVMENLGHRLNHVCTINEANMGLQLAAILERLMKQNGQSLQVGVNPLMEQMKKQQEEACRVFGLKEGDQVNTFLSNRTPKGDKIIIDCHLAARDVIKSLHPNIKVGLTLSLHDFQVADDSLEALKHVEKRWNDEFLHYLPYISQDDFLGIQNYTREIIGVNGVQKAPDGSSLTDMGYENYPYALANVVKKVAKDYGGDIIITENGIATTDDTVRVHFIDEVCKDVEQLVAEGYPVLGYFHWSLMDNFEWQRGFAMQFGLISVNRETQERLPKPSLKHLGQKFSSLKK